MSGRQLLDTVSCSWLLAKWHQRSRPARVWRARSKTSGPDTPRLFRLFLQATYIPAAPRMCSRDSPGARFVLSNLRQRRRPWTFRKLPAWSLPGRPWFCPAKGRSLPRGEASSLPCRPGRSLLCSRLEPQTGSDSFSPCCRACSCGAVACPADPCSHDCFRFSS